MALEKILSPQSGRPRRAPKGEKRCASGFSEKQWKKINWLKIIPNLLDQWTWWSLGIWERPGRSWDDLRPNKAPKIVAQRWPTWRQGGARLAPSCRYVGQLGAQDGQLRTQNGQLGTQDASFRTIRGGNMSYVRWAYNENINTLAWYVILYQMCYLTYVYTHPQMWKNQ